MHAGYLPGYPASHGCVRMPKDLAAEFFARVHIGTSVKVIGSARNVTHVRRAIPIVQPGNSRYATALFNSQTGTEWPLGLQYQGIAGKKYALDIVTIEDLEEQTKATLHFFLPLPQHRGGAYDDDFPGPPP